VLVRSAYFRICSDGTLRGPDNTIAARYFDGLWFLGQRRHASFECTGPVYLRVTDSHGRRECRGPYVTIRAEGGALYAQDNFLGMHAVRPQSAAEVDDLWREISLVTSI
jgi:hypothetical protein